MATLGEILSAAKRSSSGIERWVALREPSLSRALSEAAGRQGETPTGFARAAVADFSRFASEEDWAHLTSRLRASDDPGMDCLAIMIEWRLALEASHRSHATQDDNI